MTTPMPSGWVTTGPVSRLHLGVELRREIPPAHELYGKSLRPVARSLHSDDVLVRAQGCAYRYYVIHLTWTRETLRDFPSALGYEDIQAFYAAWHDADSDTDGAEAQE